MKINFQVDGLKEAQAAIRGFSDRRMAAAMATALTRTAVEVKSGVQARLPSVFDRPTPYTINAMRYVGATAQSLYAEVGFDIQAIQDERGNVSRYAKTGAGSTPASNYLAPNVTGGTRRLKGFERALAAAGVLPAGMYIVPGADAQIDAYGNMSSGQIIQILSQLRITMTAGHTRNMPLPTKGNERKVINAQRKAGGRYFVIPPGTKGAKPGVYRREFLGHNITPIAMFVRAPSYTPRFDFDAIVTGITNARLQPNLEQAITESAARLTARGA